eukprot:7947152-Lingulodinium_polyedra.AAC.1
MGGNGARTRARTSLWVAIPLASAGVVPTTSAWGPRPRWSVALLPATRQTARWSTWAASCRAAGTWWLR